MDIPTVEVTTDLLIIGGGMAACGAAVEAAYWAKKNGLKVVMVDKAVIDRSGAVSMGLSAINLYLGLAEGYNTPEDYVRYVRNDLMGIIREDLVYNIARHVDSSVHLFERWGLPIWKDEEGKYVHEGRWQIMINGESYKVIVAEAAKNALKTLGPLEEHLYERVFIVEPILEGNRIVGAVGFNVREEKFYLFKAKAILVAMGGAAHVFKPRSTGEGLGRSWYPPWNTGSSTYFLLKSGAEMTCQEIRFTPLRFKDGYGPVGAWFLLFKSNTVNAHGEDYTVINQDKLINYLPYGNTKPIPTCLKNHLGMVDFFGGKGPVYMRTDKAIQRIAEAAPDEKTAKKKLRELESEAWEDFLDMTITQSLLWAATNIEPEKHPSEIVPCEPYFIGSHSGGSGAWVSGPEDVAPSKYFWGYTNMSTVEGLFCAGDASGASSHKFSSGSHVEGRIAAKAAIKFILENNQSAKIDRGKIEKIKKEIFRPREIFDKYASFTSDSKVNPNFIKPKDFMFRLQKIMDEYAGGVTMHFTTNRHFLERGLELINYLKEDAEMLAAEDQHELMRCWENIHRLWQAEAHLRALLFREETRWPGYYYRADFPELDEKNWHVFVNCRWDPQSGEWAMNKQEILPLRRLS